MEQGDKEVNSGALGSTGKESFGMADFDYPESILRDFAADYMIN